MPRVSCLRLLLHFMRLAASRTFWTAGSSSPINTPMMAMTTSSSISVNACRCTGTGRRSDMTTSKKGMRRAIRSFGRQLSSGGLGLHDGRTAPGRRDRRPGGADANFIHHLPRLAVHVDFQPLEDEVALEGGAAHRPAARLLRLDRLVGLVDA